MTKMDHLELRKAWNNQKSKYKKTHTPQCRRCGYFSPWVVGCGLDLHHITALVDGGNNDDSNIVVLCHTCHDEWHRQYEPQGMAFDKFIQTPPLFVLRLVYEKRIPFDIDDLRKRYGNIKDYLTLHEPYKNVECSEYVKKHSKDWIDW
jgi:hypothetical protein